MLTLYDRLSELCKEHGIRGAKLCTDLGMSKSLMTDLKSGRKKSVSAITAQKIADYFGVTVGYLLGTEDLEIKKAAPSEADLTEDELRILSAFREMSPERQKALADLLGISDS